MNQSNEAPLHPFRRVAVVGAGPAGLYATEELAKSGASVDVYEQGFAPYGLVRYGVAPDHQKIKKTAQVFARILARPGVRFVGGVRVGRDVSIKELALHYHQVLIASGAPGSRRLGIPGEELGGSIAASEFVAFYSEDPAQAALRLPDQVKRAVVCGVGNVAIDVARILVRSRSELQATDISQAALGYLGRCQPEEVWILGRRSPRDAAMDEKELRELMHLEGVSVHLEPGKFGGAPENELERTLRSLPSPEEGRAPRRVVFCFQVSPRALLEADGSVVSVRLEENDILESAGGSRAQPSGRFRDLPAELVVRAIGYEGRRIDGVPFDETSGTIPSESGRVLLARGGQRVPGVYVSGWIKRGPSGLIGTNKACAHETVHSMNEDSVDGVSFESHDPRDLVHLLHARGLRSVSWEDFQYLDAHELKAGEAEGRVRNKLKDLREAYAVLDAR